MHTEPNLPNQNYWSKQSTPGSVVLLAMFQSTNAKDVSNWISQTRFGFTIYWYLWFSAKDIGKSSSTFGVDIFCSHKKPILRELMFLMEKKWFLLWNMTPVWLIWWIVRQILVFESRAWFLAAAASLPLAATIYHLPAGGKATELRRIRCISILFCYLI